MEYVEAARGARVKHIRPKHGTATLCGLLMYHRVDYRQGHHGPPRYVRAPRSRKRICIWCVESWDDLINNA